MKKKLHSGSSARLAPQKERRIRATYYGGLAIQNMDYVHMGGKVQVYTGAENGNTIRLASGIVCYIHPTHRYYTVLLEAGYRQSYFWGTAA